MADHFRDGAAAIRQPFCVYGADERLVAYNQAFADLHLRPDGSCLLYPGIPFQEIMEWRAATRFFAADPHEHDASAAHEYRLRLGDVIYQLADGRWMFVDNTPLPDGRLACIWSDITAVKEAERELRELTRGLHRSQDHLYRAQRVAHVGSFERDLRTGQVSWTPEMFKIFDRDPAQPLPSRDEAPKLFHPEDRARYRAVMTAAERGEISAPAEFRVVRRDGSIRWLHHECGVELDDAGKPWLRLGTHRDVTEIHEYEEKQKALQAELLTRERLSAIGSVTERLARELRDPLTTITLSLFHIKGDDGEPAAAERALGRIERSAERCNQIISDLLEYSHSGPLRCRPHDLDEWLRETVTGFVFDAAIGFDLDLAASVTVEFDVGRLRRALAHVFENAVQAAAEAAADDRAPLVVLRTRLIDDHAEIAIVDNGAGIDDETMARAFEPLYSTKRLGTGLGLTTARQIVEEHGGTISLESRLGQSTTALIRLPTAAVRRSGLSSAA